MIKKLTLVLCLFIFNFIIGCNGQTNINSENNQVKNESNKIVGGGCDGCELMYVGMPTNIHSIDTSDGWFEKGQKLFITGQVFEQDGKTPAKNIIIYYWQTDNAGYYSPKLSMDEKAIRHGHIRGWVKTNDKGEYGIYTIRPAPYPKEKIPAHIHLSIKEPNINNEYYVDELVFDDDLLLLPYTKKYPVENRGGAGLLRVLVQGNVQIAEHNIILGLNIPGYPATINNTIKSGLNIGEDQPSFIPFHAYGPDKGTKTCPVCKYGRYHGLIFFVGNNPNWESIKKWLSFLDAESELRNKYLKAYFVYGNQNNYNKNSREKELELIGQELKLKNIALTFVPSFTDVESEANLNKINPNVENTIIIYKHRNIVDKFINLKPTKENFNLILQSLNITKGNFFELSELPHN